MHFRGLLYYIKELPPLRRFEEADHCEQNRKVLCYEHESAPSCKAGRDNGASADLFSDLFDPVLPPTPPDVAQDPIISHESSLEGSTEVSQLSPEDTTEAPQVQPGATNNGPSAPVPATVIQGLRRSTRYKAPPLRLTYDHMLTDDEDDDVARIYIANERDSYQEAVRDVEESKWKAAMLEEMRGLAEHDTWILVEKPEYVNTVIDCRWVFKHKPETRATGARYKASWWRKAFNKSQELILYTPMHQLLGIVL